MHIMKEEVQFEGREISILATVLSVTTHNQVQLFTPTAIITIIMVAKEATGSTLPTVHSTVVFVAFIAAMM